MTQFYEVRNSDQKLVWIAAHETVGEHRIFVYLPNSGTWHRSTAIEDDFYDPHRDSGYIAIAPAQASAQLPSLPKLNAKTAGWLLDELLASEALTSTELGLPAAGTARPTSERQVIDILVNNRGDHWVRIYSGRTNSAARAFASEIRRGKKIRLNAIGRFEARVVEDTVVEARRITEKATA